MKAFYEPMWSRLSSLLVRATFQSPRPTAGWKARRTRTLESVRYDRLGLSAAIVFLIVGILSVTAAPTPTNPRIGTNRVVTPRPARITQPRHDPSDQLFRRAPMAESTRTIVIPLATHLHVAFDTDLLRTHTAASGPNLNLFGTPYTGSKSPFLSTFDGPILWTMPPICPWSAKAPNENSSGSPTRADFKGISTKSGAVTLLYDIAPGDGPAVRIHELPRAQAIGELNAVVRRFEITPSHEDLWFCAHAEMGATSASLPGGQSVQINRGTNILLAVVRGLAGARWNTDRKPVSMEIPLNVERKGESEIDNVPLHGEQTVAYVRIPAHAAAVAFEIASVVCAKPHDVARVAEALATTPVAGPNLEFAASAAKDSSSPIPKVVVTDAANPSRPGGDEFYQIEHLPVPSELELRVTGMDFLSKGDLAVATWGGEIYIVENVQGNVGAARYRRFARGLNEPLGLKVFRDQIYVVQKSELTRVIDTDGNGEADLFETINDDWGYSGNYHAFAFGPLVDRQQNFYAFFCGQHGRWDVPYVGWCAQITPDGRHLKGFCSGLRAPNGFGLYGPDDDLFIADNQGNWIGACKLNHLRNGKFYGFPSGIPARKEDYDSPKSFDPPAVWFPRKLSPSTSGFITATDERFGPFKGQMLVGDFQNAVVLRVFLEKVNGDWQGAVWPFAKGFLSGVNRLAMGSDGKVYVGGLKNAAWAASAPKDFSLDRVSYTGKTPFEVQEVHATARGFDLLFTQPVDAAAAGNPDNYDVAQFTYLYHQIYGSPEIDHDGKKDSATSIQVSSAVVAPDRRKVQLGLSGWKTGYVTMVHCFDLKSADGQPLWHDTFYYTLNGVPK